MVPQLERQCASDGLKASEPLSFGPGSGEKPHGRLEMISLRRLPRTRRRVHVPAVPNQDATADPEPPRHLAGWHAFDEGGLEL
jgi:hypothetical protein